MSPNLCGILFKYLEIGHVARGRDLLGWVVFWILLLGVLAFGAVFEGGHSEWSWGHSYEGHSYSIEMIILNLIPQAFGIGVICEHIEDWKKVDFFAKIGLAEGFYLH